MIKAFDIETYNKNNQLMPYCISLVWYNRSEIFYGESCVNNFIIYLDDLLKKKKKQKKKNKLIIFSHNLTFDGSVLIQNINNRHIKKYNGLFVKGNIYALRLTLENGEIIFKCTYRFFPQKLANAHKLLGTRAKLEFDHTLVNEWNIYDVKKDVTRYCINDAKIVYEIIYFLNKILPEYVPKWEEKTYSIPSISLNTFINKFNHKDIKLNITIEEDNLLRPAYRGGRCEVFGNPLKNEYIYHFDFTGMYAQVMQEEFCYGEYKIINNPNKIGDDGFFYIHYYSNNWLPILPQHDPITNKLIFSSGYGEGIFWWEEIILFLKHGGEIIKISYQVKFDKKGYIFKDFVKHFSELRKLSPELNTLAKLIINSLYGRLGMSPTSDKTVILKKDKYIEFRLQNEKKIIKESIVNDLYIITHEIMPSEETKSNVSIAAQITSKARIKLYNGFMEVINNGGRLLYTDTDSIFAAFNRCVDNETHGEIYWDTKKDDTKILDAWFALPKCYAIKRKNMEIIKIKGANQHTTNFDSFKNNFFNDKNITTNINTLKKAKYIITPENITKSINLRQYDKRKFNINFTDTTPIHSDTPTT
jgi:hypothetical protein